MYDSYADPARTGPVLSLDHRRRPDRVALLTDRMWLPDPANWRHPFRVDDVSGHNIVPNRKDIAHHTEGGNVAYVDGHIEFRWVEQIKLRMHLSATRDPWICY